MANYKTIVVDILEVPIFTNYNCHLLVVQDYFTKWDDASYPFTQSDSCPLITTQIILFIC